MTESPGCRELGRTSGRRCGGSLGTFVFTPGTAGDSGSVSEKGVTQVFPEYSGEIKSTWLVASSPA